MQTILFTINRLEVFVNEFANCSEDMKDIKHVYHRYPNPFDTFIVGEECGTRSHK